MVRTGTAERDRIPARGDPGAQATAKTTRDATERGYRRTPITSIDATRTMFSTATTSDPWTPRSMHTASWWRSAMTSRCSAAREQTSRRSEWTSETRTDVTIRGYPRTPTTSMDATRTVFSVATGASVPELEADASGDNLNVPRCARANQRTDRKDYGDERASGSKAMRRRREPQ